MQLDVVGGFEPGEDVPPTWRTAVGVTLDELIEAGVLDFESEYMKWNAPDEETRDRINGKIIARFGQRSISMTPPGLWMQQFRRKMNEIVPKYKLLWDKLGDDFNPWLNYENYGKARQIYSDYPQMELSGNSDYASNGNDREYDDLQQGDQLERANALALAYQDADARLLDELEVLFSGLITVNFNGF